MAKRKGTGTFSIYGFDELIRKYENIGKIAKPAAKKAVYKGAGIVADKVRSNLEKVLSGNSSGDLEKALGISSIKDEDGSIKARVGFNGYDSKGVPNPLKANVLESGSSKQKKRPFVRPAVKAVREKVLKEMDETFDEEVLKIWKG